MKKEEALKQIELISGTINADNQILLSPPILIITGILLCLIPTIEFTTNYLTFGIKDISDSTIAIIHWVFYFILFYGSSKITHRLANIKKHSNNYHPLLKKVFKIKRPFILSIFGIAIVLSNGENGTLIFPIILILLGILYNLLGQFTIKIVNFFSWTYIVAGLIFIYLIQHNLYSYIWIFFIIYLGATYIIMGLVMLNHKIAKNK
jgi:hypothetical protein